MGPRGICEFRTQEGQRSYNAQKIVPENRELHRKEISRLCFVAHRAAVLPSIHPEADSGLDVACGLYFGDSCLR